MSTAAPTTGLTWDEFLALPDDPRHRHAELVDGELILMNPPSWLHQHVVGVLYATIWLWTRAGRGRGTVTMEPPVQISAMRGYQPDLAWYRAGRGRPKPGNPYLTGAPDLAVEVLSESTRAFDLVRERTDYARVGVGELWLVDPEGPSVLVLRLPAEPTTPAEYVLVEDLDAGDVLRSPQLPGLDIPLADLAVTDDAVG